VKGNKMAEIFKLCNKVASDKRGEPGEPIRYRLTERRVDRDSEVIEPKGVRLKEYKKNPVVLWGHNRGEYKPAIGKIIPNTFEITDEYVDADLVFDVANDPFAAMIDGKVRDGFLNAGSIGFRPITISREAVLPEQQGATIKESELFEFSIVNVPANPGAIRKDYEKFFDDCESLGVKTDRDEFFTKYAEFFKPEGGGWDETDEMIRYRVRNPDLFIAGSFRTVPLKKDKPRVNSVMGKLKDKPDAMIIQNIMFPKADDWTLPQAKAWIKEHPEAKKDYAEDELNELATEEKVGQVISAANRQVIQNCLDEMSKVTKSIKSLSESLKTLLMAGQQQQESANESNEELIDELVIKLKDMNQQIEEITIIGYEKRIESIMQKIQNSTRGS